MNNKKYIPMLSKSIVGWRITYLNEKKEICMREATEEEIKDFVYNGREVISKNMTIYVKDLKKE